MVIGGIIALCILLLVLGFVVPRLSRGPERGVHRAAGAGARVGGSAPGPLGRLLAKPFGSTSKWAGRSASKGRQGRGKLPL